tara:strand:+ start:8167 stop:9138 length:972 start_codon:yes stop_codon:yes gene_type:complete
MPKKAKDNSDEPKKRTLYTIELNDEQMEKLKQWCDAQLWMYYEVDYARFAFKGDKVNVVAYESGKVVIQGKKTEEFVTYVIEGEITGMPEMGYEEVHHPEWFELHAGLDESGKGDLFGPLVSACVIADGDMVREWMQEGLKETKRVSSDAVVLKLDKMIRKTKGVVVTTTYASMPKYNELYHKFGDNLNKLLAWMHAKSLEDALKKRRAPWGMLDQFTKQPLVQDYFKEDPIDLKMQTKAEEDPVVAAASIVARAAYIRAMQKLSKEFGEQLLKGASAQVKAQAGKIVEKFGKDALINYAKLHFRTAREVLGLPVPPKREWRR